MLKLYRRKGQRNWRVRGTVHGIYIDRSCGTAGRKEAEEVGAAIYDTLKRHALYGSRIGTPFMEAAGRYMKRCSPAECTLVDKLIDYFKDRTIQEIRAEDFVKCAEALYPHGTAQPQTILRHVITPLTAVLNDAATYVEGFNPPRIKKGRWRGDNPRTHWLTPEQASELYERSGPFLQAFIMLCLDCGCRPGEALGVKREHVALLPNMPNAGLVTFPQTKNGLERRSPVQLRTAERLLALPEEQNGVRREDNCVVPVPHDGRVDRATICVLDGSSRVFWVWADRWQLLKEWHKARAAAGLPKEFTPHTLCHTFATWMRIYTRADQTALLATGRWKDGKSVQRYMHAAPGEVEERLHMLPQIRRVV